MGLGAEPISGLTAGAALGLLGLLLGINTNTKEQDEGTPVYYHCRSGREANGGPGVKTPCTV